MSQVEDFLNELETDFLDFRVVGFNDELVETAQRLILKYELKTLDSLQFASAIECESAQATVLVSDKRLKSAMDGEGLNTVDPTSV